MSIMRRVMDRFPLFLLIIVGFTVLDLAFSREVWTLDTVVAGFFATFVQIFISVGMFFLLWHLVMSGINKVSKKVERD